MPNDAEKWAIRFGRRSMRARSDEQNIAKSTARWGSTIELEEEDILSVLAARRARGTALGVELFSDPAWDLLLELYGAKLGRRAPLSVSHLARAIETPESTTIRWIAVLARRDLVLSSADPRAAETQLIDLTAKGAAEMKRLMEHWGLMLQSM